MDPEKQNGKNDAGLKISPRNLICAILSLVLGLGVGWLDLQVTEVILTVVALMITGLLLGLIQPKSAWRWALLIVTGLPVMQLAALNLNLRTAEPVHFEFLITLVAMAFALMGAYAGVFVRYILRT